MEDEECLNELHADYGLLLLKSPPLEKLSVSIGNDHHLRVS